MPYGKGVPMREWMLVLSPVAAVLDFITHPIHLQIVGEWFGLLIH